MQARDPYWFSAHDRPHRKSKTRASVALKMERHPPNNYLKKKQKINMEMEGYEVRECLHGTAVLELLQSRHLCCRYVCDPKYPYRSMDGSCNNLDQPLIGRSMVPHRRLLYQNYADGKCNI